MKGRRSLVCLLLALVALPPAVSATEVPTCGVPSLPACEEAPKPAPPPALPDVAQELPKASTATPKADPFDRIMGGLAFAVAGAVDAVAQTLASVGDAFATAGRLAWTALLAIGSGFAALAAGATALLRAYAAWLASLRPEALPPLAHAAIAGGATAVAAAGAQTGLWFALRKLLPWLALVPGFSRIAKDELLEHERRAALFELIKQNPGIRLSEIAKSMELAWGTAIHHLRKLRADRLVTFKPVGAHKCYFVNGSGLSEIEMAAASHLKGETPTAIASWLEGHPNASLKELAAGVGISSPLAAFHVGKLAKAGLLTKVRDGRSVRLAMAARPPASVVAPIPSEAVAA